MSEGIQGSGFRVQVPSQARATLHQLARRVAYYYGDCPRLIRRPRGSKRFTEARQMFVIVALLRPEIALADVAEFLLLDRCKVRDLANSGTETFNFDRLFRWRVKAILHLTAAQPTSLNPEP